MRVGNLGKRVVAGNFNTENIFCSPVLGQSCDKMNPLDVKSESLA